MAKHSKKKSNKDYDLLFKIMTMVSQIITIIFLILNYFKT